MRHSIRTVARQRGVALMAVILVLMALVAIALPFSLSMRNQGKAATVTVYQAKAALSARAGLNLAEEELAATDPELDPTPYHDTRDELSVRISAASARYGGQLNDPGGSIISARSEDEQGKIDVNQMSPHLFSNLLGGDRLLSRLEAAEEAELRLSSGRGLAPQGIVWIEGELILYRSLSGRTLSGLTRSFSTSVVQSRPAAEHRPGSPVLDYRALLVSMLPYRRVAGEYQGYATTTGLKEIALLGEVAFGSTEIESLLPDLTTWSVLPGSSRFSSRTRIIFDAVPSPQQQELFVSYGRPYAPGTVIRIGSSGTYEYNLVTAVESASEDRYRLILQESIGRSYDADEATVEALVRAPVNINSCSRRVLVALLEGVALVGSSDRMDRSKAELVADALMAARPIEGQADLAGHLKVLTDKGEISADDRRALLLNAETGGDALLLSCTAPFVYRSFGVFSIEAAASENLSPIGTADQGGREQARMFARQVTQVSPSGERLTLLATQLDFEEAIRLSGTGKFWTTFPENLADFDDYNQPPSRRAAWLNGRAAEREDVAASFASLAPVRGEGRRDETAQVTLLDDQQGGVTQEDRLLHFDGQDPGDFASDDINGWNVADQGPLALDVESDLVRLVDTAGWVQPFQLEMWWQPQALDQGEAYLFDAGDLESDEHAEITNRIFAYFDGRELVFRVADATVPDMVGQKFPGVKRDLDAAEYPQQYAQIRYAFDDGLEFDEQVPYHLSFYARGTKPSDLMLMVDGVPRGRRAFQTRLRKELNSPTDAGAFANIPGYTAGQNLTIEVEDATLFPPFGIVRIDNELIEYTDRTDDELIVSRVQGDAFGGRARRGSQGNRHLETELVELYGYVGVLLSERIPNGANIGMRNPMGPFGVAMVDPEKADQKEIQVVGRATGRNPPRPDTVGRGLDKSSVELPLVQISNPNGNTGSSAAGGPGLNDMFDPNGGFALIVSSSVPPPSTRGTVKVTVGENEYTLGRETAGRTPDNEIIGMGEFVEYSSFDGRSLKGVTRAPQSVTANQWTPQKMNLAKAGEEASASDKDQSATQAHVHVMTWENNYVDQGYEQGQPVFVIPLSVKPGLAGRNMTKSFAEPQARGDYTQPEMAQIGTGFGSSSTGGGTEWVRYDMIGDGCLVRDNPQRIRRVIDLLAFKTTVHYTRENNNRLPENQALIDAINFEAIAGNENKRADIARRALLDPSDLDGGLLQFRGVLGTETKSHPGGARALPVFRTFRNDINASRPGARDYVTLVEPTTNTQEEHRVNYGYAETDVEGWGGVACHMAFESAVLGEYPANFQDLFSGVDPASPSAAMDALVNMNIQSRDLTRLLKFPSGELPSAMGEQIHFGGDLHGEASPAGGVIDELEFFNPQTPSETLPRHTRFLLSRDDDFKGTLYLNREALRYNLWNRRGAVIEVIDPANNLPKDGLVVQIGDELIAISDIRIVDDDNEVELEVADGGRGYLGTPIQVHNRDDAVREMTFLRVSRLERSISETAAELVLADASDFPARGVVQVGRELLAYTRKEGDTLVMPRHDDPQTRAEVGLFRGRYGTRPEAHNQGAMVRLFPVRYEDRYHERSDDPELAWLGVFLKTRAGYFKELSWQEDQAGELASLVVAARVGENVSFADDPQETAELFLFEDAGGTDRRQNEILRQGDQLELRIFVQYKDGAFDSAVFEPDPGGQRGGSNDWKRAPRLSALGIDWIGATRRLSYEEWR